MRHRRIEAQGGPEGRVDLSFVPILSELRRAEGFRSGQTGLTVNQVANAFGGSNPPPSTKDLVVCGITDERWGCRK